MQQPQVRGAGSCCGACVAALRGGRGHPAAARAFKVAAWECNPLPAERPRAPVANCPPSNGFLGSVFCVLCSVFWDLCSGSWVLGSRSFSREDNVPKGQWLSQFCALCSVSVGGQGPRCARHLALSPSVFWVPGSGSWVLGSGLWMFCEFCGCWSLSLTPRRWPPSNPLPPSRAGLDAPEQRRRPHRRACDQPVLTRRAAAAGAAAAAAAADGRHRHAPPRPSRDDGWHVAERQRGRRRRGLKPGPHQDAGGGGRAGAADLP